MNIFFLSSDPWEAAQLMCDQHISKMPAELGTLLSLAHIAYDGYNDSLPFYPGTAYMNNPMAKWVRTNSANYEWAFEHFKALNEEYFLRYGAHKVSKEHPEGIRHASWRRLKDHACNQPRNMPRTLDKRTEPDPLVDEDLKNLDTVCAYRAYYIRKRREWATRKDKKPIYMTWYKGKAEAPEFMKYPELQIAAFGVLAA